MLSVQVDEVGEQLVLLFVQMVLLAHVLHLAQVGSLSPLVADDVAVLLPILLHDHLARAQAWDPTTFLMRRLLVVVGIKLHAI